MPEVTRTYGLTNESFHILNQSILFSVFKTEFYGCLKPIKTGCNVIGFAFKEHPIYFIQFCECIGKLDFTVDTQFCFFDFVKNVLSYNVSSNDCKL